MRLQTVDPYRLIEDFCDLRLVDAGPCGDTGYRLQAILGCSASESSFKSILGLGLLILAREQGLLAPGQPVIESTSGSLGVGLAVAGRALGHPVHLVSDRNIPVLSRRKVELLGATLHLVHEPDPQGGMQQARDVLLGRLLAANPDFYWTDQNDSPLNPLVYRRWLIPRLEPLLDFDELAAGVFSVGSGGHFSALSEMLLARGVPSFVGDRHGSITFGGAPGPSILRGTGNQNKIPRVIDAARDRVAGVYVVDDEQAAHAVRQLAAEGISVGGSSGVCYVAAHQVAEELARLGPRTGRRVILTFFPDRGELYGETFLGRTSA
jgi:cysteine synthase A